MCKLRELITSISIYIYIYIYKKSNELLQLLTSKAPGSSVDY